MDQKKLEKAEAKLREKAEKRGSEKKAAPAIIQTMATATQVITPPLLFYIVFIKGICKNDSNIDNL